MSAVLQEQDPLTLAEHCVQQGDFIGAIKAYEGMIEPAGDALTGLIHNLVPLYLKARKPSLALRAAEALTFFAPRHVDAWMALAQMRERFADWEGALQAIHQVLSIDPEHEGAHQSRLFLLGSHGSPQDIRRYHEDWARTLLPTHPLVTVSANRSLGKKLRIGYLSGDFRKHVMDRVIEPLLKFHNPDQFEIFCYDTVNRPDDVTARLRTNLVQWRILHELGDAEAADMIRQDGIDILVDLSGITFGQRLKVLAMRPAPIQLTTTGYLLTTGASCFDYKVCDSTAGPQSDFTEPLWRIPNALCMSSLEGAPPVGSLPYDRNGFITFGCVNSYAKVTRDAINAWIEVLRRVPTSRLVMVVAGCSEQETALAVLRRFGPVQDRVLLTEWATGAKFPTVFNDLDIAFNTHPYGGCATSFDTLWQGTPIVCMNGDRPTGRYAAHYMRSLDLHQFISRDWNDYIKVAVDCAHDVGNLRKIRRTLRTRIKEHHMFDVPSWVRQMENAYKLMWARYAAR